MFVDFGMGIVVGAAAGFLCGVAYATFDSTRMRRKAFPRDGLIEPEHLMDQKIGIQPSKPWPRHNFHEIKRGIGVEVVQAERHDADLRRMMPLNFRQGNHD